MSNHEKESWESNPFNSAVPDFIPTSWARGLGGRPVSEARGRHVDRDGVEYPPSDMSDWLMTEENVMSSQNSNATAADKVMVAFVKISIILSVTAASIGLGCAAVWFAVSMMRGMLNAIG